MGTIRIIFLKNACVVSGVSVLQWRSAQAPSAKNKRDIVAVVHTTLGSVDTLKDISLQRKYSLKYQMY